MVAGWQWLYCLSAALQGAPSPLLVHPGQLPLALLVITWAPACLILARVAPHATTRDTWKVTLRCAPYFLRRAHQVSLALVPVLLLLGPRGLDGAIWLWPMMFAATACVVLASASCGSLIFPPCRQGHPTWTAFCPQCGEKMRPSSTIRKPDREPRVALAVARMTVVLAPVVMLGCLSSPFLPSGIAQNLAWACMGCGFPIVFLSNATKWERYNSEKQEPTLRWCPAWLKKTLFGSIALTIVSYLYLAQTRYNGPIAAGLLLPLPTYALASAVSAIRGGLQVPRCGNGHRITSPYCPDCGGRSMTP